MLRDSDSARRGGRSWRILPRAGQYYSVPRQALDKHGYIGAASAFYGCEMELLPVNLVFSHERELWWRDTAACPLLRQPTFTMTRTGTRSRPCSISPQQPARTARSRICEAATVFGRATLAHFYFHLGHAMDRAAKAANVGSPRYYRRGFTDPALRTDFVRLPRVLQGATHFGDDLHQDDPLTARLLAREHVVESSAGNMVLFNGGDLLHRGGPVQRGERWSLQLMFGPRVASMQRLLVHAQHPALAAAGCVLGWDRLDRVRERRRSQRLRR